MRVDLDNLEQIDGIDEGSEDFATLFNAMNKEDDSALDGGLQEAQIVKITDETVLVDIGQKSEGRLHISEISNENGDLFFNIGDKIVVFVTRRGERFDVSYKKAISLQKNKEKIAELGENYKNAVVEGVISKKVKSGIFVDDNGFEYFIPRSQASSKEDVGKKIKACIIKVNEDSGRIIASRKKYFDVANELQLASAERFLSSPDPLRGVVKHVENFGLFVSVDGVEGLVHFTEITHKGPVKPSKFYQEGDEVFVKAIKFDAEKKRLSFSIKALYEDPWKDIKNTLEVGYTIKATVSNIEDYGVFVDVGNDLEGFLHISEISWDKGFKHPSEKVKLGDELEVEIIEINQDQRRLRVSLKKLQDKPFSRFVTTHKEGDILDGKVQTITDFGAFLNLKEIDGLLHNEDASWDKGKRCKDFLKVGDSLKVKLIKIDHKNERISLSLRELQDSPVQEFAKKHKIDDIVQGKVIDVKDFGVFIDIDGIHALIRNEDIGGIKKDEIKKGEDLTASIVQIDAKQNKVRASMRRVARIKEKEELKNFNANSEMTLGDKLKGQLKLN
ncbi:MAG: 30S ribosomal protein S1 [Helicobacter sp.]|nr:30S ribosomal protein S1 [Helicobacter sp.]